MNNSKQSMKAVYILLALGILLLACGVGCTVGHAIKNPVVQLLDSFFLLLAGASIVLFLLQVLAKQQGIKKLNKKRRFFLDKMHYPGFRLYRGQLL